LIAMKRLTSTTFSVAALLVAAVVTGFSIAQAVRQDSFDPIFQIAWLPAVIAAMYYARPVSGRSCSDRLLRRMRS
jgi:hypothetical protein